jgi:hypothetical protein
MLRFFIASRLASGRDPFFEIACSVFLFLPIFPSTSKQHSACQAFYTPDRLPMPDPMAPNDLTDDKVWDQV